MQHSWYNSTLFYQQDKEVGHKCHNFVPQQAGNPLWVFFLQTTEKTQIYKFFSLKIATRFRKKVRIQSHAHFVGYIKICIIALKFFARRLQSLLHLHRYYISR